MRPIVPWLLVPVAALIAPSAHADCVFWNGQTPDPRSAASVGDRLLVQTDHELVIVDRDGQPRWNQAIAPDRPAQVLGGDQQFYWAQTVGATVRVERLGLDGEALGPSWMIPLGADARVAPGFIDRGSGGLAVAWSTQLTADAAGPYDVHLALRQDDGTPLPEQVVPARRDVFDLRPVALGQVVWLLWREWPPMQVVGMRFSAVDGRPLDAAPIVIAPAHVGYAVARTGATLRLYAADDARSVVELSEDGTVQARLGSEPEDWEHVVGLPTGAVLHLGWIFATAFPAFDTTRITHEDADGVVTPFLDFVGSNPLAIVDADGALVILAREDTTSGFYGTATLVLRRVTLNGIVTARQAIRSAPVTADPSRCNGSAEPSEEYACSAAGGRAGVAPLLLVLGLGLGRRRRRAA